MGDPEPRPRRPRQQRLIVAQIVRDEAGRLVLDIPMPSRPGRGYRVVYRARVAEGELVLLAPI